MNEDIKTEKQEVLTTIARILNTDRDQIVLDARIEDLAEDSVQLFSLILALEKKYDAEANYDDLVDIVTVGDIIAYIDEKTGAKKSETKS